MRTHVKRITSIADEITTYLLLENFSKLSIMIEPEGKITKLRFVSENSSMTKKQLDDILLVLNQPRQIELETYYWTLLGESGADMSLNVVGRMIDTANGYIENGHVILELTREEIE
jgi:mannose-1-phosphate guanylyltransferase